MFNTCTRREGRLLEEIDSFNDSCVIFSENLNKISVVIEDNKLLSRKGDLGSAVHSMENQIDRMEVSYKFLKRVYHKEGAGCINPLQTVVKMLELSCIISGVAIMQFGSRALISIGFSAVFIGWGVGQITHSALLKSTCKLDSYRLGEEILAKEGLIAQSKSICSLIKEINRCKERELYRYHNSMNERLISEVAALRRAISRHRVLSFSSESSSGYGDVDEPAADSSQTSSERY